MLEGFIRSFLRGVFNEIEYLGGISTVESSYTVVELGYTRGHASDGKLGPGLGKPNSSIVHPELWKFDCHIVDVERDSYLGFGHCQDRFLLENTVDLDTRSKPV